MEGFRLLVDAENLEVVRVYLFGPVKFIHLLFLTMVCDIITGIMCAIKEGRLRSRTALYSYARKGVFIIIIAANIADQVFGVEQYAGNGNSLVLYLL